MLIGCTSFRLLGVLVLLQLVNWRAAGKKYSPTKSTFASFLPLVVTSERHDTQAMLLCYDEGFEAGGGNAPPCPGFGAHPRACGGEAPGRKIVFSCAVKHVVTLSLPSLQLPAFQPHAALFCGSS